MSGFSAEERSALLEPLGGLQVDPNAIDTGMEQIDAGDAGRQQQVGVDLSEYEEKYGKKAVEAAYKRGWRPKEEHKGNPDNWLDPIDFFDRYADTSDKRAEKAAEKKMAAIVKTVEARMEEMGKRLDRVDETDRQATEEYYTELIANAKASEIPTLLKKRDEALEALAKPGSKGDAPAKADPSPEAKEFFGRHPYLATPETASDKADRTWAMERAAELEAKHPNASAEQVFNQLSYELKARRGENDLADAKPANKGGRRVTEDGGSASPKVAADTKYLPANMTAEEKTAFNELVRLGAYKEDQVQQYCDDLAKSKAEMG